ncbi:STAS domain-containing protein [Paenibacillus sp. J2TS4]|uniref:STAS domain-containing protein n=1 Tax=Paenibacillus sp. J2TS4 TaxID=2807194 RepID=UPI001B16BC6B|nr:STAS domain-containing protein [Paenibacillus sp. J2TS4]GIP34057.1 anti-sigma factor antagonist [Paenibacillus sp. J2TS4]
MNQEKKFNIYKEVMAEEIVIYLSGELDLSVAPEMRSDLEPFINQTKRALTLNLKDLKYIDSTGIGILVSILKTRDALKAPFGVEEIPPKIKRLFDITGISQYICPLEGSSERKEEII